jgi:hypothetical protein
MTATLSNGAPTHILNEEHSHRQKTNSQSPHAQINSNRVADHHSLDASELAFINKIKRHSQMQTSLNNDLNNSLSTSPIRAHINQATFDILKSELQMTKT